MRTFLISFARLSTTSCVSPVILEFVFLGTSFLLLLIMFSADDRIFSYIEFGSDIVLTGDSLRFASDIETDNI